MNVIVDDNNRIILYEGLKKNGYDILGNEFPPEKKKKISKNKMNKFVEQLSKIQNSTNITQTDEYYEYGNYRWNKNLLEKKDYIPSRDFTKFIDDISSKANISWNNFRTQKKVKYLSISHNQMLLFDSLLKVGGYKRQYLDPKRKKDFRYSEQAGLLDFDENGLDTILVDTKVNRAVEGDNEILFPNNRIDAPDYEYMFHTHPATPVEGGRVDEGILYEFPSWQDVFHFIEHYNKGITQGSIIFASEGYYILTSKNKDIEYIPLRYKHSNNISEVTFTANELAIDKYGSDFTTDDFYSKISQNKKYAQMFSKVCEEIGVKVDYYPRAKTPFMNPKTKKIEYHWTYRGVTLPVKVIEPIQRMRRNIKIGRK